MSPQSASVGQRIAGSKCGVTLAFLRTASVRARSLWSLRRRSRYRLVGTVSATRTGVSLSASSSVEAGIARLVPAGRHSGSVRLTRDGQGDARAQARWSCNPAGETRLLGARTIRLEMNAALRDAIFAIGPEIRYVAVGEGQHVETAQRDGIAEASDASSDFFEELLVNPTLLTLARQRGDLDCGGLRHVIVAYGNFNQVVVPTPSGHVSVCVERDADADAVARRVAELLERR
jgi:hypothetical protein